MKTQSMRGIMTDDIRRIGSEYLGRPFTQDELRLYPYLCDRGINGGLLEIDKLNCAEINIISRLVAEGRVMYEVSAHNTIRFYPSRPFYMFMQSLMMEAYIVCKEDTNE